MSDSSYVCPNGHDFPATVAVPCGECNATVTCEPASRGMALHAEVERLRAEVAHLRSELDYLIDGDTGPGGADEAT